MIPSEWLRAGGNGVRVGVIDTGLVLPSQARIVASRSFLPSPINQNTLHGTEVVRVIASADPDDEGLAPGAEVVYAKAIDSNHSSPRALSESLRWLIDSQCQVINMSFAMPHVGTSFSDLIIEAGRAGIFVVCSYAQGMPYPHTLPDVIQVGATGSPAQVTTNNFFPHVKLPPKTGSITGSSISAAIISGVAACAKAYDQSISRSSFLQRLGKCSC